MKFQSLISRVSVVLFAAALTMTSCTKDESPVQDLTSTNVAEVAPTPEQVVVGNWTAKTGSTTSGVTFNDRTGSSDKSGLFSIQSDGVDYSDFTWSVSPTSAVKNKYELQLNYGAGAEMQRTYDILSMTAVQIALASPNGTILLQK